MTKPADTSAAADQQDWLPPSNLRTLVSFLLFVHVFAVLLAAFSNPPSSELARRMRGAPFLTDYLQALYLDTNFRYPLTQGNEFDWAPYVQITPKDADEALVLSAEPISPPIRRIRYQSLLNATQQLARMAEDPRFAGDPRLLGDRDAILPRAIGAGLMREQGWDSAGLLLRSRELQPRMYADGSNPDFADPRAERWFADLYRADVNLHPSGQVIFVKQEEDRRTVGSPEAQPSQQATP